MKQLFTSVTHLKNPLFEPSKDLQGICLACNLHMPHALVVKYIINACI